MFYRVKKVFVSTSQIGADDKAVLDKIIDSLTSLANPREEHVDSENDMISLTLGKLKDSGIEAGNGVRSEAAVLILGAGRVCRPAAEFLTAVDRDLSKKWIDSYFTEDMKEKTSSVHVIVASLFLKDAEEVSLELFTSKFRIMFGYLIKDDEGKSKLRSAFYDMEQITEGLPNATAIQLDITNEEKLHHYITQVFTQKSKLFRIKTFQISANCFPLISFSP